MPYSIQDLLPNLKPFVYEEHFDTHFINIEWVLVNGISEKKSIYKFNNDNTLEIRRKDELITTTWHIDNNNIFTVETDDGTITVKAFFKDDDVLILKHQNKQDFALYINTANYNEELNSVEDIQLFLKDKYKKKLSSVIYDHKFYYISKSKEFGPNTVKELSKKVKQHTISPYCFVRDINETNYAKRLRIIDLIDDL